ncbi:hypothetical protein ACWT_3762 [Actinoplanes sp. SE50]|uniref:hypothetical protein n=1 Tax=unclassified Actinoplanes TaxID=2626549 RepID=UPI00023ECB28|nr:MULTISPECIES: hypothetical protein [unclassified Actinoplanes]AEV84785.1 hypothetical protein ACPL_3890 [Actinoplanes sp. SE50/110]ATO83177.1 hypothetical protein ACWT_3762 [Actinoplanes sp. SE50]SLM00584.1 hypothetical protein ACSP50_3817 [Actinoplanes sp. SE50/110]
MGFSEMPRESEPLSPWRPWTFDADHSSEFDLPVIREPDRPFDHESDLSFEAEPGTHDGVLADGGEHESDLADGPGFPDGHLADHVWMTKEVTISILADAVQAPEVRRATLTTVTDRATISDSFCVVIGDHGQLEYRARREIGTVEFAPDRLREDLGFIARWALDRLVENPGNLLLNGIFQAAVWGAIETPCTRTVFGTGTDGPMQIAVFDCARVMVGDHAKAVVADHRSQEVAEVDFARLIPGHPGLVRALAEVLADPLDQGLRDGLDRAARAAADDFAPGDLLDAAATDGGARRGRIDFPGLFGGEVTVDGVIGAVIGTDITTSRSVEVRIDAIAITGDWGGEIEPAAADERRRWNELEWFLLQEYLRKRRP